MADFLLIFIGLPLIAIIVGWSAFVHIKYSTLHDKIKIDKKRGLITINKKNLELNNIKEIAIENFEPMSDFERYFTRLDWYYQFSKLVFIKKNGKIVKCTFNSNWKLYNTLKNLPMKQSSYKFLKEDLFNNFIYFLLSKLAGPSLILLTLLSVAGFFILITSYIVH